MFRYRDNYRKKYILLVVLFIAAVCCNADNQKPVSKWYGIKLNAITNDFGYCKSNLLHFAKAPKGRSGSQYLFAGSILSLTAFGLFADQPLRHESLEMRSSKLDKIILPWKYYGEVYIPAGIAASLYIGGIGFSNNWFRETGRECMMSIACAGLVSTCLKFIVGRERPYENEGAFDLDPFSFRHENTSFPSGHTTTAFAFSTALASRINNPFATIVLLGLASLTAAERVYCDDHWLTDVTMGAIIGTATGLFIVHDSNVALASTNHSSPRFETVIIPTGTGIAVCQSF